MHKETYMAAPLSIRIPDPTIDERIEQHLMHRLAVGKKFPDVPLTRYSQANTRENFFTVGELSGRRVVAFTFPGAFTPTCTGTHLKGVVDNIDQLFTLGFSRVICIVPDKLDVAHQWNLLQGHPKIDMWADNLGELTDKMGLGLNMSGNRGMALGLMRSAMVIDDGIVEWIQIEENAANCGISHANSVIAYCQQKPQQQNVKRQKK
jgi:peroxiredoxin